MNILLENLKSIDFGLNSSDDIFKQFEAETTPFIIKSNGEAKAVMIGIDSYKELIDSINLLKIISIGENDYNSGNYVTNEQLDSGINKLLS